MARRGTGTARRAVTAFFDDRAAAQQAVDDLAAAGVARDRITLVEGGAQPGAPVPSADKGIWATVKDLFMADEDRHAYGEGLRRGGFLLSVATDADDRARRRGARPRGRGRHGRASGRLGAGGLGSGPRLADLDAFAAPAAEAPAGTPSSSDAVRAAIRTRRRGRSRLRGPAARRNRPVGPWCGTSTPKVSACAATSNRTSGRTRRGEPPSPRLVGPRAEVGDRAGGAEGASGPTQM